MNYYSEDTKTALQSKEYAQFIAFAPMVFHASKILRDKGLLAEIHKAGPGGISLEKLTSVSGLPRYGVRVLVEAGLGIGLILENDGKYTLTGTGVFILSDQLTKVNMDFSADVCYEGLMSLEKSIETGKPEGLKVFGEWPTIYEGLSKLPEPAKKSWFDFDHFYSDSAFTAALNKVMAAEPARLLDIGGNTGKWAIKCVSHNKKVAVTILDLPGQTKMAKENIAAKGLQDRVNFFEGNILDSKTEVPKNFDAIWMSQFLDCFSEDEIVSILSRCAKSINENGFVYILETFWDRQRFEASAFCLQMTSLYFTAMANGNSQMYDSRLFLELVKRSGLEVVEITDNIGVSHSLLKCKKK